MNKASLLKSGLRSLIGVRQNSNPNAVQFSDLLTSDSGLYYQSGHPLVTIKNFESVSQQDDLYVYDAWNIGTSYVVGDIVTDASINYIALTAHTGTTPPNATDWKVYTPLEERVKEWIDEAIIDTVSDWFTTKSNMNTSANLLENDILFSVDEIPTDTSTSANFSGLKIKIADSNNLKTKIIQVGTWLETAQTVNIKIFQTGISAPIYSDSLVVSASDTVQWFDVDVELDSKHEYRIGYEGLTGGYYNYVYNSTIESNRFFAVNGFVRSDSGATTASWATESDQDTYSDTYGLNLKMSSECDYTQLILDHKNIFATAIMRRFAINFLNRLAHNPEAQINRNLTHLTREQILFEIQGNEDNAVNSLYGMYRRELEAVTFDQTKVDSVCLPCDTNGVNYRSV